MNTRVQCVKNKSDRGNMMELQNFHDDLSPWPLSWAISLNSEPSNEWTALSWIWENDFETKTSCKGILHKKNWVNTNRQNLAKRIITSKKSELFA